MPEALVVGIVREAIETAIAVSLPMLLAGLIAGVIVSIGIVSAVFNPGDQTATVTVRA